jgi:hypothetical protein
MRSFWAICATPHHPTPIHPALTSFADECCGTLARLVAYVGVLTLLAIAGIHLCDELLAGLASEPAAKAGWSAAVRSYPAFAISRFDFPEKTEAYEILRHPEGGALPARRAAIGCILNRLILLTTGNEPKLAELFARAELKHGSCAPSATSAASVDWVTSAENPLLRGIL